MNRKLFNAIIAAICSAFLITIAATGIILYSDYKTGAEAAKNRFEKLFNQTEDAISRTQIPNEDFVKAFTKAVGSTDYYYSLNLKSGNCDIYQYPSVQKKNNKLFTKTWSRRITEGTTLDLNLTALIYALPANIIYARLRIAFIVILGITVLSGICLIYLYTASEKKAAKKDEDDDFTFKDDDFNFEDDKAENADDLNLDLPDFPEESYSAPESEVNADSVIETSESPVSSDIDSSVFSIDEPQAEANIDLNEPSLETDEPTIVKENNSSEEPVFDNQGSETTPQAETITLTETQQTVSVPEDDPDTNTLFGTVTGFCSEKILVTRLESELSRASSSELDISLILIKIPGVNFDAKYGIEICNQILNIFHYRDILFEYKNDGVAIIFNGADIDKAMEISEQMYAELCSILTTAQVESKPVFGIASRSLRFISGERLIIEAEQALIHAAEDPESPIIAFRVNPEKYRRFMASKE